MRHRVLADHVGDQLRLGRCGELAAPALDAREGLYVMRIMSTYRVIIQVVPNLPLT